MINFPCYCHIIVLPWNVALRVGEPRFPEWSSVIITFRMWETKNIGAGIAVLGNYAAVKLWGADFFDVIRRKDGWGRDLDQEMKALVVFAWEIKHILHRILSTTMKYCFDINGKNIYCYKLVNESIRKVEEPWKKLFPNIKLMSYICVFICERIDTHTFDEFLYTH